MEPPVAKTLGSSVERPSDVRSQGWGSLEPSLRSLAQRPAVTIELEMSMRIGSGSAGIPAAIGLGVITAFVPPKGATKAALGSELKIMVSSLRRAGSSRNDARQPM